MDKSLSVDEQKIQLENEKAWVQAYIDHPITQQIFVDNQEQQDKAVDLICNVDIDSFAAFFAHFAAVGHLRGLRRAKSLIDDKMEGVLEQIKNLN